MPHTFKWWVLMELDRLRWWADVPECRRRIEQRRILKDGLYFAYSRMN